MKIIYISGIDGCGKSTQAKLLVDLLKRKGLSVTYQWLRWEPSIRYFLKTFKPVKTHSVFVNAQGNDKYSIEQKNWLIFKRRIFTNFILRKIWLSYACFDYFLSYKKRLRKVTTDIIVIDRYLTDFIIDQAVNLSILPYYMDVLYNNFFLKKFHFPELNIIIDLPAHEGFSRKNDGTPLSYLQIREKYYLSMNYNNTLHLNGLNTIDELTYRISHWVIDKLGLITL